MICSSEAEEFVPYGRQLSVSHPGKTLLQHRASAGTSDHGLPLLKTLKDLSLKDMLKKDTWSLRRSMLDVDGCDEELYVQDQMVVWSRGTADGATEVIKTFSMDSPVQEALWCTFLLPVNEPMETPDDKSGRGTFLAQRQQGVCIVEQSSVSVFTADGRDYLTAVPFQVSKTWAVKDGLLFERCIPQALNQDVVKTPRKEQQPHNLPMLFSMLHPLDEVAPVICRTGGSSGKISFVTEVSQQVVYTHKEPSLVVTYDKVLSAHSVWTLRRAKPEEAYVAVGGSGLGDTYTSGAAVPTPGASQSASGLSRLTLSSNSPSVAGGGASPFRSYASRVNSPSGGPQSRISSPSMSRLALSRSQSPLPSSSFLRLQSPSPKVPRTSSPAGMVRTPVSVNGSILESSYMEIVEPLAPEICLDHLWTESGGLPRDGAIGRASKVFITADLCGQSFLCYLISYRHQLRCVKFDESNDKSQLIFGSLTLLQARDATPLQSLNMMLVQEMDHTLVLYTGLAKVNRVHINSLPACISLSGSGPVGAALQPSTPLGSPARLSLGPVTSSRPPSAMDARFDEEVRLLSPVPTEFNESSPMLDDSFTEELSFHPPRAPRPAGASISGVADPVDNRFNVELSDGSLYRTSLPPITTSPIIHLCLEAIKHILPKDMALQVLIRWYSTHNAPGSLNGQSEWTQFIRCLLGMMGYEVDKLALTQVDDLDGSLSPVVAPKKLKPSEQGSEEDWEYMLGSDHHQLYAAHNEDFLLGLDATEAEHLPTGNSCGSLDPGAPLYPHLPAILFALHLVYEELNLDVLFLKDTGQLGAVLCQIARDLHCERYADHYCRQTSSLFASMDQEPLLSKEQVQQLQQPSYFTWTAPSIYQWLCSYLSGHERLPFPYLPGVSRRTMHVIAMYVSLLAPEADITWSTYLRKVSATGRRSPDVEELLAKYCSTAAASTDPVERVVLYMAQLEPSLRDTLAHGVILPLREAIARCRNNPPGSWSEQAYKLIDRDDLAKQKHSEKQRSMPISPAKEPATVSKGLKEEEDGMEYLDKELLKLRFSEDLRVQEVRRLLQSARPVKIAIQQRPEVSDHEFIEEQERHLYATCIRTMALPMGRGMFCLSTYLPVPTETLPIPKLCLTGRAPPRNTTVDLTHIETPPNMTQWPQFHNGVAAGLRIANSLQLDSTWILYNKPKSNELTNEHAGFLMGLGLNGHLASLATLNVHDYLVKIHEMTSVGLLLGISAGRIGTMDVATIKLLSIHLAALLPPTCTELNIPHNVQVAAILGVGLVYQGTAHRHIAEVLLQEIGRPPGPEMENCTDRESYSLAAGLALGLVMLGKGPEEMGLSDLGMADQLYHYMAGGHKRPLTGAYKERFKSPSYQIKEGDSVNVDVTSPGATLALGMMFFRTNNSAVAEWLTAPDTQFLLDFVRPDFLMLRIISRGLVMWEHIHPSEEWVNANLPEIVQKYAFNKMKFREDPDCDIDFETMSQAYCNIVCGACMAMGLRFAGSANEEAFHCLYALVKKILKLLGKPLLVEQAGRSTVENCFVVIVMALAMVMAGTGNLEVLRLCKHLRSRIGPSYNYVLYGSHMAVNMALGLLFLGGGRYTLCTKPEAVAAMLCAFFPKFPIHSNDNRYHLQAFRHLYVLAAEPRVIVPRDVDNGHACYVPLEIIFKTTASYEGQSVIAMAPCVLPELELLQEVKIQGPRYWSVSFTRDKNWDVLRQILKGAGFLYVKQRAGHLSYMADPKGYHSVLAQSLTGEHALGRIIKTEDIKSFSSDQRILAFAEYFCSSCKEQDYEMVQLLSQILYECVSMEKLEVLTTYINLHKTVDELTQRCSPLDLWQLRLMWAFYQRAALVHGERQYTLISQEFLCSLKSRIEGLLAQWVTERGPVLRRYLRGESLQDHDCQLLSALLSWHNFPHPSELRQIQGQQPSFPVLYRTLGPSGLPVSAIMALSSALQTSLTPSTDHT